MISPNISYPYDNSGHEAQGSPQQRESSRLATRVCLIVLLPYTDALQILNLSQDMKVYTKLPNHGVAGLEPKTKARPQAAELLLATAILVSTSSMYFVLTCLGHRLTAFVQPLLLLSRYILMRCKIAMPSSVQFVSNFQISRPRLSLYNDPHSGRLRFALMEYVNL